MLKGDVEVVTKLTTFEETITIRIKRITAKKRTLLEGFTWSKDGIWSGNDWGVDNYVTFETFFEFGDKDVLYKDTSVIHEEELNVVVVFSPELDKVLVWSYGNWTKDSFSGETEFVIPTPTYLKKILDEIKSDLERTAFNLSVHPDYADATIWSLNGGSPPYWSKIGFTRTLPAEGPSQALHEKQADELLSSYERTGFDISLTPLLTDHKPVWSMRFVWSETGIEVPSAEPVHSKYQSDLLAASERISLAQEFLTNLEDELLWSKGQWSKHPIVESVPTENIILKEIEDTLKPGERFGFALNEPEDGFFWSMRGWSTDDWGNIPKSLAQQDIQHKNQQSIIQSSDKAKVEFTFDNAFNGWSIKLWSKDGWISFQQPPQQPSTHSKSSREDMTVGERVRYESLLAINAQSDYVHTKSKWSEATW